ncbi:hypothetical protein Clacol_005799 [Clathrus columnatus]|uniref:Uncharacterized protein n=1 Tax=Clathrus columnatus TaxID=1419009 RepID=A0AAV5AB46_9AGAM|nr:hypothetical protein Clacol_005799 [Clathrus columnatus]
MPLKELLSFSPFLELLFKSEMMYFPSFWSRWKLPRWSNQQLEDILPKVANVSDDDVLPIAHSLIYEPSTSATSDGFLSPLLTPSSHSNNLDFHLQLPEFTSLIDDLPELLQPSRLEVSSPSLNSVGSIRDRRDDLIGELLDQVSQLRQKVRSLGDDNSRLRHQLTDKRFHDSVTNCRGIVKFNPYVDPKYKLVHIARKHSVDKPGKYPSSQEDDRNTDSQEDCDSAYSYYNNPDYFPKISSPISSTPLARLRAKTESILSGNNFVPSGYSQRRRYYSLPTPKQCREYAESRLKDGTKLELGAHLRRLINLRCSLPSDRTILNKTIIHNSPPMARKDSSLEISPPTWSLRNSSKRPIRRPQPRIQLSVLEGNLFLFKELKAKDFSIKNSSENPSRPLDENAIDTETQPFVEDLEDEVDDLLVEEAPLSSVHLLEGTRRENVESFVTANEHAVSDAQRRRERHIALLDSIMEEEELEDGSTVHLPSLVVRTMYASINYITNLHNTLPPTSKANNIHHNSVPAQMAQATLAIIPEHELESSESTTISQCPPLTEDSFSSMQTQEQDSLMTLDDFEDIDFASASTLRSQGSESTSGYFSHALSKEVNTVAFPITHSLTGRLTVCGSTLVHAC